MQHRAVFKRCPGWSRKADDASGCLHCKLQFSVIVDCFISWMFLNLKGKMWSQQILENVRLIWVLVWKMQLAMVSCWASIWQESLVSLSRWMTNVFYVCMYVPVCFEGQAMHIATKARAVKLFALEKWCIPYVNSCIVFFFFLLTALYNPLFNGGKCSEGTSQLCLCLEGFHGPRCLYGESKLKNVALF